MTKEQIEEDFKEEFKNPLAEIMVEYPFKPIETQIEDRLLNFTYSQIEKVIKERDEELIKEIKVYLYTKSEEDESVCRAIKDIINLIKNENTKN